MNDSFCTKKEVQNTLSCQLFPTYLWENLRTISIAQTELVFNRLVDSIVIAMQQAEAAPCKDWQFTKQRWKMNQSITSWTTLFNHMSLWHKREFWTFKVLWKTFFVKFPGNFAFLCPNDKLVFPCTANELLRAWSMNIDLTTLLCYHTGSEILERFSTQNNLLQHFVGIIPLLVFSIYVCNMSSDSIDHRQGNIVIIPSMLYILEIPDQIRKNCCWTQHTSTQKRANTFWNFHWRLSTCSLNNSREPRVFEHPNISTNYFIT